MKRWFKILLVLLLVISYVGSVTVAFVTAKRHIEEYLFADAYNFDSVLREEDLEATTVDEYICQLYREKYGYQSFELKDLEMPVCCILAYDENGSCVASVGDHPDGLLRFNMTVTDDEGNETTLPPLRLKSYMTESVVNAITSCAERTYFHDTESLYVQQLTYTEINGEMVPVSLILGDKYGGMRSDEIKLTHHTATASLSGGIIEDGIETIELTLFGFVDCRYNQSLQQFFRDTFSGHESITPGWNKLSPERSYLPLSWFHDQNFLLIIQMQIQKIAGKRYEIYWFAAAKPVSLTLRSTEFLTATFRITCFFIIVSMLSFIAYQMIYKRWLQLDEAQRAFAAAAAHELKTPLAIIQNQSEFILEKVDPKKTEEYVRSIYDESLRMNRLVAMLLQYNRLSMAGKVTRNQVSLSAIAVEEAEKYRSLAAAKGVAFECDIKDGVNVKANSDLIALVIDNFLSNAVKYTLAGKQVTLTLREHTLTVRNEGAPITASKQAIWGALYHSEQASDSSGMGLAVSKQILQLHHYRYGFKNDPNGVSFFFSF
ncbi:MAG: HAMP domain-containing histidine kinase [Eubacterium sp.]|nr:HAMP domain-containing histidine kinase [Eubacterium sp.]